MCNLGVCGPRVFQNWLESLWLIWSLDVHLFMYTNLHWASLNSWFLCSLLMYICRLCIAPMCEPIGTPLSQYDIVWAVCIWVVPTGLSWRGSTIG